MNEFSKKMSILKTYIEQNITAFKAISIILLIIPWGFFTICLGRLVLSTQIENMGVNNLFGECAVWLCYLCFGALIEFLGIFYFCVLAYFVFYMVEALVTFIRKQKAIHNYLYLPLTADEINKAAERNEFNRNVMDYLEYIDNKLSYYGFNKKDYQTILLNIDDIFKLMYSIKDVFNINNIDIVWFDENYDRWFEFASDFFKHYISSKSEILDEMSLDWWVDNYCNPKVTLTLTDDNTITASVSFEDDDKTVHKDKVVIQKNTK